MFHIYICHTPTHTVTTYCLRERTAAVSEKSGQFKFAAARTGISTEQECIPFDLVPLTAQGMYVHTVGAKINFAFRSV